jgi:hypothetical protein
MCLLSRLIFYPQHEIEHYGQGHDNHYDDEDDLSPEEVANNLSNLDKDFTQLFDMSIAYTSSQNYLFDIIGLREKRSLDRTSRFKVLTREAKALVSRLESKISLLSRSLLKTNNRVVEQDDLLQEMRAEIADNRWIFELKNIDMLQVILKYEYVMYVCKVFGMVWYCMYHVVW